MVVEDSDKRPTPSDLDLEISESGSSEAESHQLRVSWHISRDVSFAEFQEPFRFSSSVRKR